MRSASRGEDPVAGFNFIFEVDDQLIGHFTEVAGIAVEMEVETVVEGGNNQFEHKLPGRLKWPNITLKRGVTSSQVLFAWLQRSAGDGLMASGNTLERSTGRISMLDQAHDVIQTWEFEGAFPVKYTGPSFAAASTDVGIEELEISHNGFWVS